MIKVNALDHINMSVSNVANSIKFYKDVFGFEVLEEKPYNGKPHAIIGRSGHILFALYEGREDNKSYINHLGFHVEDFDSVMEKLVELNVEREFGDDYIEYPNSRSIYIFDPDGMEIELSEKFGGDL